ncbi:MAG: ABC transporter permease subunit [Phycisphaerales bacterium]|jgi:ABC-type transport system involved in multi-copper enzyme maturation permease subunit
MKRLLSRALRLPRSIARTFVGPIFQREVRALGRRRAPHWVRAGYTLVLLGIVSLVFFAVWDTDQGGMYAQQSVLEYVAPAMLSTVAVVQMFVLALIAPVLTAGAIADEKRQRTLSTLLTTPLTSRDIIMGKLGSRTVQLVILALVPMPLLLALRVFGGVEAEAIFASVALALGVGMLGASLALMFSIWHRRTPSVVFFALCSTAVLVFIPWLGMMATEWSVVPNQDNAFFKCIAPIALVAVLFPEDIAGPTVASVREFWVSTLAYLTVVTTAVVLFSIYVLRGVLKREASGTEDRRAVARLLAPGGDDTVKTNQAVDRDSRTVGDRPVLWRELRLTAIGNGKRTLIAFGIGIGILLFLYAIAGLDHSGLTTTLLVIAALAMTVQAALSTPTSISSERDAGSWSVLLATPVRPAQVVVGKALGSVRRLWLVPAVMGFHLVLVMATGWFHPIAVLHAALLLGGLMLLLAGTGVLLGLMCKRGVTASVLNMAVPLVLFLGVPIAINAYVELGFYRNFDERSELLGNVMMFSNPFVLLTEASTTATAEWDRFSYFLRYEKIRGGGTMRPLVFTGMVLVNAAALAAIGAAALGLAAWRFNRFAGRPS